MNKLKTPQAAMAQHRKKKNLKQNWVRAKVSMSKNTWGSDTKPNQNVISFLFINEPTIVE